MAAMDELLAKTASSFSETSFSHSLAIEELLDEERAEEDSDYDVVEGTEVTADSLIAPIVVTEPEAKLHIGFVKRLTSGNLFLSGRQKCKNIIMSIADKASSSVTHEKVKELSERVSAFENYFSPDIVESCKHVLKILRDYNNSTLIQETWLTETNNLLESKRLTIGVFGRHKAGKSTLLNALLHQEVLSHAVTNETAFILSINHVPHNNDKKSCANLCEESLLLPENALRGRREIRNSIRKINYENRNGTSFVVQHGTMAAHVPFICQYSTSNIISIELMDTPGLSEANQSSTLQISELSEHQLMTCSAFVYVISCLQLQDAVDEESFQVLRKRDSGVFTEKRIIIVVTRLDEYKMPVKLCNDKTEDSEYNSDSEEEAFTIEEVVQSIKSAVKKHFKKIVDIPDDCIIPVCASGANEARKANFNLKCNCEREKLGFKELLGRDIRVEELEALSQIEVLEKRLGCIAADAPRIWKYSIARDCCRYLDQSVIEIMSIEKELKSCGESYHEKAAKKKEIIASYRREKKALKLKYEHNGHFHEILEKAYDKDMESHHEHIIEAYTEKIEKFCESVKSQRGITLEDFCQKTKVFIEITNQETELELNCMKFKRMNAVIYQFYQFFGLKQHKLMSLISAYCEIKEDNDEHNETIDIDPDESEQSMSEVLTEIITNYTDKYSSQIILEFKDLLAKSKSENLTFFEKLRVLIRQLFEKVTTKKEAEISAEKMELLLQQLKEDLISTVESYLAEIKIKILECYLRENQDNVAKNIRSIEELHFQKLVEMHRMTNDWKTTAKINDELARIQHALGDVFKHRKFHLLTLIASCQCEQTAV